MNDKSLETNALLTKHRILQGCRDILKSYRFIEVSTPALRGAANAVFTRRRVIIDEPYATTKEAFLKHSHDTVLRTLLRYHDRIFELGPCYRIDSPDETHHPEFLLLELAANGESFDFFRKVAEQMLSMAMCRELEFETVSVKAFMDDSLRIDLNSVSDEELRRLIVESDASYASYATLPPFRVVNRYISEKLEGQKGFRFLTDYPICTISKAKRVGQTNTIHRFELFADGLEVAHSYLYESDVADYRRRSESNGIVHSEVEKTLRMMANGEFPQLSGILGIGIERLCCASTRQSIQQFVSAKEFSFLGSA